MLGRIIGAPGTAHAHPPLSSRSNRGGAHAESARPTGHDLSPRARAPDELHVPKGWGGVWAGKWSSPQPGREGEAGGSVFRVSRSIAASAAGMARATSGESCSPYSKS